MTPFTSVHGNLSQRDGEIVQMVKEAKKITGNHESRVWLLLMFTLPARRASERVSIWRKLQHYGALALPSSGYVLPDSATNRERFEWLAASIRNFKGHASVAQVANFDDLPGRDLEKLFTAARSRDYEDLGRELKKLARAGASPSALARINRRLQQIAEIDFFGTPARAYVEQLVKRLETGGAESPARARYDRKDYTGRTWITRPRPGIDRVASAWLIRRCIDARAKFIFDRNGTRHPHAVPFDMFNSGGFGHAGDDCTFETLLKNFKIKDPRLKLVAQAIHDADLADERFGRDEALGVDRVLEGWAHLGVSDDELLRRGMEMIEGLYNGIR
jgi:hypothetical protein